MNSSLHISTYESVRVINSLITQKIQYVPCQVCVPLRIDPEKPGSLSIHQKFGHYPREFCEVCAHLINYQLVRDE